MHFRQMVFLAVLFMAATGLYGQKLPGQVLDSEGGAAASAVVYWIGTETGTTVDAQGDFFIPTKGIKDRRLIVRFVGHHVDTFQLNTNQFVSIRLVGLVQEGLEITDRQDGTFISSNPIKTEVITQTELEKSACCDLAGCFNTQSTVQAITTNIVTNSKELRILGLSGVYNQVLIDGMPMMIHGQTYTYGISTIPGPLVDKIFVAKGANSVLQGFESISGQINVIPKTADGAPRLFFNAYANSFLETQYNLHYAHKWNKWRTIVGVHSTQPARSIDRDEDAFIDVAKIRRYSAFNTWNYGDDDSLGLSAKISGRFIHEERQGGQVDFNPEQDMGSRSVYGQKVGFDQTELSTRVGYRINAEHNVVVYAAGYFQDQDSWYGLTRYQGQQMNGYVNAQYELVWKDQHQLKTGLSYRHVDRTERIVFTDQTVPRTYGGTYLRQEMIPGIFAENTFRLFKDKMTLITGVRMDHHNNFGWKFTPRSLMKYDFDEQTSVRLSAGTGWRTANIFTENVNLLASSRDVIFTEALQPEQATNLGFNITHSESWGNVELQVGLDAYRIQFQNQIFPDYDTDPTKAYIGNFTGPSISNGAQAEVKLGLFQRAEVKASYNYLDVFRRVDDEKFILPFNSLHRVQGSVSYAPLSKSWQADANIHWFGAQRLANTAANPPEYQVAERSAPYTLINGQLTKYWDKFSIYGGCENIFDFRQLRPITSWQDPFSPYFDTANVWGPTRGREFYLGLRLKLG